MQNKMRHLFFRNNDEDRRDQNDEKNSHYMYVG